MKHKEHENMTENCWYFKVKLSGYVMWLPIYYYYYLNGNVLCANKSLRLQDGFSCWLCIVSTVYVYTLHDNLQLPYMYVPSTYFRFAWKISFTL